jgi:hypothetical protein
MALLDTNPLAMLLGQEQMQKAENQALNMGALNAIAQLLAASGSQARPIGTGQAIGQALLGGYQGYQSSMDKTLGDMLKATQVSEMLRKQKETEQIKQLMTSAAIPKYDVTPAVIPQGQTLRDDEGVLTMGAMPEQKKLTGYSYDISKIAPALYAMGRPEVVKNIAEAEKAIGGKGELTGEYANVALGIYGTADVSKLPANAFATISEEIARQNKAKATTVNMPSEGERKAGTLAYILDKNISQLQAAVGKDPTAVKPNVAASVVKGITGSDYLQKELTPDQRQVVEASQLDILDAALTLRTGAAYTREQLEGYRASYFPQIGDKPEQIKAKQQRLETLLDAAFIASGRAKPERVTGQGGVTATKPTYRFNKQTGQIEEF